MAQFDVYRVRGGELVVDCQADLLDDLPTRFVVPLRKDDGDARIERLTPSLVVGGDPMTMLTPLARGIAVRDIEATIGSVAPQGYAVKAALDFLISAF